MVRLMAPILLAGSAAALGGEDATSLVQVKLQGGDGRDQPYYWAGKNGDAMRTGNAAFPMPVDLQSGPAWSWHEGENGLVRAAPLIDGDKSIYLSSIAGNVYKFSPDGKVLWRHYAGASIPEVPAIMGGALFATNTFGEVFALNMTTGSPLWKKKAGKSSAGDTWSMTAADGIVVAALSNNGAANDHLTALDAKDGAVKWSYTPKVPVYNSLSAVFNGSLVFSDLNGRPYRLSLADGSLIWKSEPGLQVEEEASFTTGGAVIGPDGTTVYVTSNAKSGGSEHGHVTAFRFADGKMLWRQGTDYQANNAAAVGRLGPDGPVAVVVGVGPNPDMPDWLMQMTRKPPTSEKRGRVMALDARTGRVIWKHELPMWHGWAAGDTMTHVCLPDSFGNPVLSGDGTVFVGFESGRFYGINDRNHDGNIDDSEVSSYNFDNAFQGSPGLAPGMLVATPCNGLHVFRSKSA